MNAEQNVEFRRNQLTFTRYATRSEGPNTPRTPPDPVDPVVPETPPLPDPRDPDPYPRYEDVPPAQPIDSLRMGGWR